MLEDFGQLQFGELADLRWGARMGNELSPCECVQRVSFHNNVTVWISYFLGDGDR